MSQAPANGYNPDRPPSLPSSFEPPETIINPVGDFFWYQNWEDKPADAYGFTGLYDPANDRLIVENRLKEYVPQSADTTYTHSDMVEELLTVGPIARFPQVTVPAEAGGVEISDETIFSGEIPTAAQGAFVSTQRLSEDKEFIGRDDTRMTVGYIYKYVYGMALLDFPPETTLRCTHVLTRRRQPMTMAAREFELRDAYMELQFAEMLPDPVVETVF